MSALGQKRTYALQQAMSALHLIATAKADFRTRSCLLYPESGHVRCTRFDYFVCALLPLLGHVEVQRLGGLEVDDQFEFCWLQNGKDEVFGTYKVMAWK